MADSLISSSSPNDSGCWVRGRDGEGMRGLITCGFQCVSEVPLNYSPAQGFCEGSERRPRVHLRRLFCRENNWFGWHRREMTTVFPQGHTSQHFLSPSHYAVWMWECLLLCRLSVDVWRDTKKQWDFTPITLEIRSRKHIKGWQKTTKSKTRQCNSLNPPFSWSSAIRSLLLFSGAARVHHVLSLCRVLQSFHTNPLSTSNNRAAFWSMQIRQRPLAVLSATLTASCHFHKGGYWHFFFYSWHMANWQTN